jgi:hypothetical protein
MMMQYIHGNIRPELAEGVRQGVTHDRVCPFARDLRHRSIVAGIVMPEEGFFCLLLKKAFPEGQSGRMKARPHHTITYI